MTLKTLGSVLGEFDCTLGSHSTKHCLCLGKYMYTGKGQRSRFLLVKLIRVANVTSVLAKRGSGSGQYRIKPDHCREDWKIEFVLLKKKWDLITSGIPKKNIKFARSSLFVKRSLHDKVANGLYIPQSTTFTTTSPCAESMFINITPLTTTSEFLTSVPTASVPTVSVPATSTRDQINTIGSDHLFLQLLLPLMVMLQMFPSHSLLPLLPLSLLTDCQGPLWYFYGIVVV